MADRKARFPGGAVERSVDGERLIAVFSSLVEPLGRALPSSSEVVLHDLSLLPNSIVAIYGDVTGRRIGDPATDKLLGILSEMADQGGEGAGPGAGGYETVLPDGRRLRSSTMMIRDVSGAPVAALCINTDLSAWFTAQRVIDMMLGGARDAAAKPQLSAVPPGPVPVEAGEVFPHDVDELAALLIQRALDGAGIPVDLMHKKHKIEVVRDLKARGLFLLRDAVDMVAASLGVTRFTIYNYLNEIADDGEDAGDADDSAQKAQGEQ